METNNNNQAATSGIFDAVQKDECNNANNGYKQSGSVIDANSQQEQSKDIYESLLDRCAKDYKDYIAAYDFTGRYRELAAGENESALISMLNKCEEETRKYLYMHSATDDPKKIKHTKGSVQFGSKVYYKIIRPDNKNVFDVIRNYYRYVYRSQQAEARRQLAEKERFSKLLDEIKKLKSEQLIEAQLQLNDLIAMLAK